MDCCVRDRILAEWYGASSVTIKRSLTLWDSPWPAEVVRVVPQMQPETENLNPNP